ncbi:hypothetical protein, variant 3 [Aphanomyces astaci]|uniref:Aromatic amino acid beta-eliminating lyase/threonine aldolase domain-containing protein n=1 Tax=Aphanomyces astaci TaxID=112090 RepID=W4H1N1_APHAT|nr:hypothetical protein, variant 2 [Aphanomyces astaci]XP_009825510.1 hypothetical protein, variant 3 [Aphanomyces astaci]ETV85491.1 hypothetical protein, variant 2 [Aphanomyces astaci]ETV85492.1 hypothetical protein, variant 3 [Aphanomyces astaci]|eukprot:XP_009825509.1 hypothetical protein, variant 2 [Aphanomyces astaci]
MRVPRNVVNMISDTVTQPCARMRQAMATAVVGDDVHGTDPTVRELQRTAADLLGKPAALFVPSGTMGNLIAVGVHCNRGDEVILGNKSHVFKYEGGGVSAFLGASMHTVPNQPNGELRLDDVEAAIRDDDPHYPKTKLVIVENTHNTCGGRVVSTDAVAAIGALCVRRGLHLHIDGARLANASVYLDQSMAEMVAPVDSVSLCLSKGLGAPAGSIIAGSEDFIYHATRLRKALGGGMRQSGVLAAAGLVALGNIDRLAIDHSNALRLALGLAKIPGIHVNVDVVETNLVYFSLDAAAMSMVDFLAHLEDDHGVWLGGGYGKSGNQIRAALHLDVNQDDVEYTLKAINAVLSY